jgi:hypothetical protein
LAQEVLVQAPIHTASAVLQVAFQTLLESVAAMEHGLRFCRTLAAQAVEPLTQHFLDWRN